MERIQASGKISYCVDICCGIKRIGKEEDIIACSARKRVPTSTAVQDIITIATVDIVIVSATVEDIIAIITANGVITDTSIKPIYIVQRAYHGVIIICTKNNLLTGQFCHAHACSVAESDSVKPIVGALATIPTFMFDLGAIFSNMDD